MTKRKHVLVGLKRVRKSLLDGEAWLPGSDYIELLFLKYGPNRLRKCEAQI
jgi:hypothetical protein